MFFDVARRQTCTVTTERTNTPLHALATLNDVTYVEAARAFAQRVLAGDFASDQEALVFAMRLATARNPSEEEVRVLAALLSESRAAYHGHEPEALALLELGALPRNESIDPVELAAWTQTTRAILNLHETITRD